MTLEVANQIQNTHDALKIALEAAKKGGDANFALDALEGRNHESLQETGENYVKRLEMNEKVWGNQKECCNFINTAFQEINSENTLPDLVLLES